MYSSFVAVLSGKTLSVSPSHPTSHTDTHIYSNQIYGWQSAQTSVFLWSKCARPGQLSSVQGQQHTIHHKPLSNSRSLCAPSVLALLPSVFPSRCLLLSVSLTTNAPQFRVSCMLYIASFHYASVLLTHFPHTLQLCSIFFLLCTIISTSSPYASCPLVPFLALPVLASLSPYPSLSLFLLLFCLLASRAPGLKHAGIHYSGRCMCMYVACVCRHVCSKEGSIITQSTSVHYADVYAISVSISYKL